jgi:hypothetical protein
MDNEERIGIGIGGLVWSPTSHVLLSPVDANCYDEQAARLLSKALEEGCGRIFGVVPDMLWLRNVGFHTLGWGGEAATTQARIPILVGNSQEVLKKLGWHKDLSTLSERGICIQTIGPALVICGTNNKKKKEKKAKEEEEEEEEKGKGTLYACCYFLFNHLGFTLQENGKGRFNNQQQPKQQQQQQQQQEPVTSTSTSSTLTSSSSSTSTSTLLLDEEEGEVNMKVTIDIPEVDVWIEELPQATCQEYEAFLQKYKIGNEIIK